MGDDLETRFLSLAGVLLALGFGAALWIRRWESVADMKLPEPKVREPRRIDAHTIDVDDTMIWVAARNGIRYGIPVAQHEWLRNADLRQRLRYRLDGRFAFWDDLDGRIDLGAAAEYRRDHHVTLAAE